MNYFKQCLGVDISKDKFDCCLSIMDQSSSIKIVGTKYFSNNINGFSKLLEWVNSKLYSSLELTVVMEATGVYYENLAYFLNDNSPFRVCVLLPLKAKYYFKSLELKTKTDKVDAQRLSQLGLERKVPAWKPMSSKMKTLKLLSREYRDSKKDINRL